MISGSRETTERAWVVPPDDGKAKKIRTESRKMKCGRFLVMLISYVRLKGGGALTDAIFPFQTYTGRVFQAGKRPDSLYSGVTLDGIKSDLHRSLSILQGVFVTRIQKLCRRPSVKPEGEAKQRQITYRTVALKG